MARNAFKGYVRAYNNHKLKDIFSFSKLDINKTAKSFGFEKLPSIDLGIVSNNYSFDKLIVFLIYHLFKSFLFLLNYRNSSEFTKIEKRKKIYSTKQLSTMSFVIIILKISNCKFDKSSCELPIKFS